MGFPQTGTVPAWSLGDRLRKARETAGLTQQELADQIEVARASVVNWETGRFAPRRYVLVSWALACGVSFEWLAGSPHPPVTNVGSGVRGRKSPRCTTLRTALAVAA